MHETILNITNYQGNTSQNHNSARRKKEILPFVTTWMDLEDIMLSEIKLEQDKYKNFSFTCEILNFKKIIFF